MSTFPTRIHSNAKLNLYLRVTGKINHYHVLDSVFVPLSLHDDIHIDYSNENYDRCTLTLKYDQDITIYHYLPWKNTILKALYCLRDKYGFKQYFDIDIQKYIPIGSGLGGASSNAAAVIKKIVDMLQLNISEEEMLQIGREVGDDVPFFFFNKPCIAQGVGNVFVPLELSRDYKCIIVYPMVALYTVKIFKHYSENFTNNGEIKDDEVVPLEVFLQRLHGGELHASKGAVYNALTKSAASFFPEIHSIVSFMKAWPDCVLSSMTGSGSTCFAIFDASQDIAHYCKILRDRYPNYLIKDIDVKKV